MAYLDNASTTKPFLEVCDLIYQNLTTDFGNPSSLHSLGRFSNDIILNAKKTVALKIGANPSEIVFTSGATESINMAIFGTINKLSKRGKHIITTEIEHSATLSVMHELKLRGFEIDFLSPDKDGKIDPLDFEKVVREDTILASVILVNNEVGALNDVCKMAEIFKAKSKCGFFHIDAVAGFCKTSIDTCDMQVDLISISGHKVHAPKGVGALYIKKNSNIKPLIFGGNQQSDLRAGTENVSGILGFAKAVEIFDEKYVKNDIYELNAYLKEQLVLNFSEHGLVFNGVSDILNIVNFSIPSIKSEVALRVLESFNVYVSSGSACNKGKLSHVLKAMDVPNDIIDSALRVSFSAFNTKADIDLLISALNECLKMFK